MDTQSEKMELGPKAAQDGPAEADGTLGSLDQWLARHGMLLALAVALTATLGSLYLSEVRHYIPCRLCWFQRIFMYPLALLIPIGLLRRDRGLRLYVLPMAAIGGLIALYHVLLQKTNLFQESAACLVTVPCSSQYISWFGFVTIPVMALAAFVLILLTASTSPEAAIDVDEGPPWRSLLSVIAIVGGVFAVLWVLRL